jgi:TonB-linked SusC/RagA family outer membrane protein
MKHKILIVCLLFLAVLLNAQKHIIRGKITDDSGGIIGGNVIEIDANERFVQGTVTNIDGDYSLQVSSAKATIQFSYVGYKTVTEKVNGRSTINVKFESNAIMLKGFVVEAAALGTSMTGISKRDMTGSSTLITMDNVKSNTVSSVDEALQGQVAGLDIVSSGSPGSGASIAIRGLGSLGGSNPLIVVDGIIQRVNASGLDFGSADQEDIGMLLSIAPEDIKAVRVLKDAAETALYGTRGANGVIEIETRKGNKGKTKFDASYKKSLSFESPRIPMLNGDEYVMLQQEMYHNRYGVIDMPREISNDIEYDDYYNYAQNTDWVGDITRLGQIDDFGFTISGGGDKTTYYTSINYQNNIGTVKNTANERITSRINLGYNISNKLRLNTEISYVNINNDNNWGGNNVRSLAYRKAPNMSIYKYTPDGERTNEFFTPLENYQGNGVTYFNPSAVVALSNSDQINRNFQTNFTLKYEINKWFSVKQVLSFQFQNSKRMEFLPYTAIGAKWLDINNNSSMENNSTGTLINSETLLQFEPIKTSRHSLSGIAMLSIDQDQEEYILTTTGNSPSTFITDPAASPLRESLNSGSAILNSMGILANLHYKFIDRHIFQFNIRTDASSRFGTSSRWGTFPSVSYAWRFSDEPFIKKVKFLDDSKIRFSYGLSGNSDVRAYDRHALYASTGKGAYMDIQSIIPTQAQLQKLQWETSGTFNVGLDLAFFKNRLQLIAEYYNKITENILWPSYKLPSSAGFTTLKQYNDGKIQNSGFEITANVTAIKTKDFTLRINYNIYFNENKFLSFPTNIVNEQIDISNGKYPVKAEIGKAVGSFFGFRYLGVYPTTADAVAHNADGSVKYDPYGSPIPMNYNGTYQFEGGDAKYQDVNYDGTIDLNDVVYLGDSNPDFAGGLGFNVSYKDFQFSASFVYRYGYKIVNQVALNAESMSNKDNQSKAVLNRWRVSGDDYPNMIPRAYQAHPANNLGSDRYVEDASYLRLNNISLNYSLPAKLSKMLKVRNLSIGLQARKILTFTNYTGQDPEVQLRKEDALWFGKDTGTVPSPIVTAFNLSVGF